MAYNEHLAERIAIILEKKSIPFYEKKMFGGVAFMVDEKMCIGVIKEEIMARVGDEAAVEAKKREGVKEMSFTGKPMKDYLFIEPEAYDMEEDLEHWVELCLTFNPVAKRSKKRKPKA